MDASVPAAEAPISKFRRDSIVVLFVICSSLLWRLCATQLLSHSTSPFELKDFRQPHRRAAACQSGVPTSSPYVYFSWPRTRTHTVAKGRGRPTRKLDRSIRIRQDAYLTAARARSTVISQP